MDILLHKLLPNDITYFKKWWLDKELIILTSGADELPTDTEVKTYFEYMINDKINYNFMIEYNNETVGHISLNLSENSWWETQIVIGEKDFHNKGIGSAAISELIKFAKQHKITNIFLEVRPDNLRAIRSYEKCGFERKEIVKYPENKNLPETLRMELECRQL